MAILHMDTDDVDRRGRVFLHFSTDMMDRINTIRYSIRLLESCWEGNSSDQFVWEFERVINQIERHISELDNLSGRIIQEEHQWLETDNRKPQLSDFYRLNYDLIDLPGDALKIGSAIYIIKTFHPISSTRPFSVPIHGKDFMLKAIGLNPKGRIMRPDTILKQIAKSATPLRAGLFAGISDGLLTGVDSYFSGDYAGTSRALPAAITDGLIKGVVTGLITAGLVAATSALVVGATPIVAATAVIGACVIVGPVIDKLLVDPLFDAWKQSYSHSKAVEGVARIGNEISNFFDYQAKKKIMDVRSAFSGFINSVQGAQVSF